jgi:hypothetical protein
MRGCQKTKLWPLGRLPRAVSWFAAGCATQTPDAPPAGPPPAAALPSSIPGRDLVGRWGYASYHKEADRPRTEAAARGQCGQPYVIGAGPSGGVLMHLADEAQRQELQLVGRAARTTSAPPDRRRTSRIARSSLSTAAC